MKDISKRSFHQEGPDYRESTVLRTLAQCLYSSSRLWWLVLGRIDYTKDTVVC